MTFDASASTASGGVFAYNWAFNEEELDRPAELFAPTVAHDFKGGGMYPVSLTVYSYDGASSGTENCPCRGHARAKGYEGSATWGSIRRWHRGHHPRRKLHWPGTYGDLGAKPDLDHQRQVWIDARDNLYDSHVLAGHRRRAPRYPRSR